MSEGCTFCGRKGDEAQVFYAGNGGQAKICSACMLNAMSVCYGQLVVLQKEVGRLKAEAEKASKPLSPREARLVRVAEAARALDREYAWVRRPRTEAEVALTAAVAMLPTEAELQAAEAMVRQTEAARERIVAAERARSEQVVAMAGKNAELGGRVQLLREAVVLALFAVCEHGEPQTDSCTSCMDRERAKEILREDEERMKGGAR